MPRVAVTLSLSLSPATVKRLEEIGEKSGRTAARVAAELVNIAVASGRTGTVPQACFGHSCDE